MAKKPKHKKIVQSLLCRPGGKYLTQKTIKYISCTQFTNGGGLGNCRKKFIMSFVADHEAFYFPEKTCFETAILPNSSPTVFLFHLSTIFSIKSYKCLMAMKLIPDSLWMAGCPNAHRSAQYCPALSQVAGDPGTPACLHGGPPAFQLYWKKLSPKKNIFASHIVEQEAGVKCLKARRLPLACMLVHLHLMVTMMMVMIIVMCDLFRPATFPWRDIFLFISYDKK